MKWVLKTKPKCSPFYMRLKPSMDLIMVPSWKRNIRYWIELANELFALNVGLPPSQKNCFIFFNKNPLKMMKNAFYFILKALFVLKIFKFLSWLFRHVGKTAWLEIQGLFQNLYVTAWLTSNCNTHIAQYLTKWRQPENKIWSVII